MAPKSKKPAKKDAEAPAADNNSSDNAKPDERLHIVMVDPISLKPHPHNPRIHPDGSLAALMKSMEKYGWTDPILISRDNLIIAGHARWKTAMKRGMLRVPCIKLNLEGAMLDAYVIASNRLRYNARYNNTTLKNLVKELKNSATGIEFTFLSDKTLKKIDMGQDINPDKDPSGLLMAVADTIIINPPQDDEPKDDDVPTGGKNQNGEPLGGGGEPGGAPIGYLKENRVICPFCGLDLEIDEETGEFKPCDGGGGDMEPEVDEDEEKDSGEGEEQ
jgi:hypothetical protein